MLDDVGCYTYCIVLCLLVESYELEKSHLGHYFKIKYMIKFGNFCIKKVVW